MIRVRNIITGQFGNAERYKLPTSLRDHLVDRAAGLSGVALNDWVIITDEGGIIAVTPAVFSAEWVQVS